MPFTRYLNSGEEIVLEQRRHPAPVVFYVFLLVFGLPFLALAPVGTIIVLALWWWMLPRWGVCYAITDRRVLSIGGFFSRKLEEISLQQATRIEIRQPIYEWVFGCGELIFDKMQAGDFEASSLHISFLRNPAEFRRRIEQQRELLLREGIRQGVSLQVALQDRAVQALSAHLQQALPSAPAPKLEPATQPPPVQEPARVPPPPLPENEQVVWYFSKNGDRKGPVSARDLRRMAKAGELRERDLVWKEGMKDWAPAAKVKGLFSSSKDKPDSKSS